MTVITVSDSSTREQWAAALAALSHRAGRMTIADIDYPELHADIDKALTAWQKAPA